MFRFLWLILYLPFHLLYPCKVINRKNFRITNGLVVCNHLSNTDVFYIALNFVRKNYYLAKKELFKSKIKNWFFKAIGAIPIDRNKIDISAIKQSLKILKNNKKLIVFPEGTRNKENEDLQEIKNGSAMLAIKAQVPIIPLYIDKKARVFRRNKLTIGKPFELEEFYNKKLDSETLSKAGKIIEEKMKALSNKN